MTAQAIQAAILNGTTVAGLVPGQSRINHRLATDDEATSGTVDVTGIHNPRTAPMATLVTRDLQTIATLLSGGTKAPFAMIDVNNVVLYSSAQSSSDIGFDSGSVHTQYTIAKGIIILDRLSWRGGKVEASLSIYALSSDGTTAAVAETYTNALPTQPVFTTPYGLTSLVGGSESWTTGVQSLDVSVAHGVENNVPGTCYNLDLPHPVALAMPGAHGGLQVTSTVTLQKINANPTTDTLVATFTAMDDGGFLASDTVVFTMAGKWNPLHDVDLGTPSTREMVLRGKYNGSTEQITITP